MKEFFKGSWLKGVFIGVVVFMLLDFISTGTNDDYKKAIFREGYMSAVADAQWAISHKDSMVIYNDSVRGARITERIDKHWERVIDLMKNGDE